MKLAITVQNGTLSGKKIEVTEGFLTVGRGANCNLVFDPNAENMVSTKHAYIETKPDGFYLIDNKSTNGTFVNGQTVQITKLNSGDVIQFGKNGPEVKVFIENQTSSNEATTPINPNQFVPQNIPQQYSPPIIQPINSEPTIVRATDSSQMQPTQAGNNWGQLQNQPMTGGMMGQQSYGVRNSFSYIGLGQPEAVVKPDQTGKYIGFAVAILVALFFTLIVTVLIVADVGIFVAIFATIVAFIPAAFYILPLMGLDRYDPEPPWLLALAFAWGALVAVVVSYFINSGVGIIAYVATGSEDLAGLASAVFSAPIFEEGSKGLGVLLVLIFFRKYFDDILDGIVYAGVIALGFATVENIFYYGRGFYKGGLLALVTLFVIRGILSPFAHVTFTSMTGIGCGISRESHNRYVKMTMPVIGYFSAVFLHSLWNGMSIIFLIFIKGFKIEGVCQQVGLGGEEIGLCGFMMGYGILEVPLFLMFAGFALYIMRRQNKILKEMLALDVARGVITQEHLDTATSVFKSTFWVFGSIFSGKYGARSKYLRAIGKLGLSYWHIQRATAAQGQTASFQQNPILRDEVLKWRDKV